MERLRSGKAVIKAMIATFRKYDWTQGEYTRFDDDDEGKVAAFCLLGCLWHVEEEGSVSDKTYIAARNRLRRAACANDIVEWNDRPGRTKRQVMAMLRRAAT